MKEYSININIIGNSQDFLTRLEEGAYQYPGGYPIYFVTAGGGILSFESAEKMKKEIVDTLDRKPILVFDGYGFEKKNRGIKLKVVGWKINYEDQLKCKISGEKIESLRGMRGEEGYVF